MKKLLIIALVTFIAFVLHACTPIRMIYLHNGKEYYQLDTLDCDISIQSRLDFGSRRIPSGINVNIVIHNNSDSCILFKPEEVKFKSSNFEITRKSVIRAYEPDALFSDTLRIATKDTLTTKYFLDFPQNAERSRDSFREAIKNEKLLIEKFILYDSKGKQISLKNIEFILEPSAK